MNIFYITPYTSERNRHGFPNIGGAINETVKYLPDDCYVCVRDGDTMFLTSDWGTQIEEIIAANSDYDLITCMTNRIGIPDLCVPDMFDETNIQKHIDKATLIKVHDWDNRFKVEPTAVAPGMLMIFKKSLWSRIGGFPQFDITFDRVFSNKVKKIGGKIGVARGLYIWHSYRFGEKDPKNSIKHLTK